MKGEVMKHKIYSQKKVLTKAWCPHLEPCDVRDHVGKKCIAGDIERHPEAHITRALVQLTRQLAVTHVELTQGVAGRQSHEGQVCVREDISLKMAERHQKQI